MRAARRPLAILGALLATPLALVALLAGSEAGSRWVVAKALSLAAPEARVGYIEGTLARGLVLDDLHLPLASADIRVARVESAWNPWPLLGGHLSVQRLILTGLTIRLADDDPDPEPPGPWPNLAPPLPVSLAGGDIRDLRIARGDANWRVARIVLAASSGPSRTRIRKLEVTQGEHRLQLAGQLGNRMPYPLRLDLAWSSRLPDGQPLAGRGTLAGDLRALNLDHRLSQPATVTTQARLGRAFAADRATLDLERLALSLESQWQALALSLPQLPTLASDGHLAITGNWADYRIELAATLVDPAATAKAPADEATSDLPARVGALLREPATIALSASGQGRQVRLEPLAIDTRAGDLDATGNLVVGDLTPDNPLRWEIAVTARDIDTAVLAPARPARLAARVESEGHWRRDDYRVALTLRELAGDVLAAPLTGSGRVTLGPGAAAVDGLVLTLGDNHLALDGPMAAHRLDLRWRLDAPRLADFGADLAGTLTSAGTLTGTAARPGGELTVSARGLRHGDQGMDRLDISARADPGGALQLDARGGGIRAGPLADAALSLRARGEPGDHRLHLALDDGDSHLALALAGGLDGDHWRGELGDTRLRHPRLGGWRQDGAASLAASAAGFDLGELCLASDAATLCARARLADHRLDARGQLANLPVAALARDLPAGASLAGTLASGFQLAGPLDALDGELSLASSGLRLGYQPPEDVEALDVPAELNARATLAKGAARARLAFTLPTLGALNGEVGIDRLAADGQLQGALRGQFTTLTWLDGFFPELDNLDGRLALDLALAGQPAAPRVAGSVAVDGLEAQVPVAGIQLADGRARLTIDGDGQWQLAGGVTGLGAEGGESGALEFDGAGLRDTGTLALRGEDVLAVDRPDARVRLSPDLRLALGPEAIDLDGEIAVTGGHFILGALPARAVKVSPDERIFPAGEEDEATARPLRARVRLSLDDSFRVEGHGLATRVGGNLRITQRGDDPPRAAGTLTLVDGVYAAYGQSLAVERGYLIFQGPLDNPGLNIRAVRKTASATVGIDIGGVAQDIRSELFSTPPLTPTETLAILITGKPPGGMNAGDANQVVNAAAALGIAQGDRITDNLQRAFGLDRVDLRGGDDYLDSALVVGKYLAPDLFVSYVQDLFSPAGSIQLDYNLGRHLGIKATSGETQSVDLLYRVEH